MRALVLGGGGVAGIAWELGVLAGLADAGVNLLDADLFIGTSAGAAVAAQVTSGVSLPELFDRQLQPADKSGELMANLDMDAMASMFGTALRHARSPQEVRAAIGRVALDTETVSEEQRRAVIERRLPVHVWSSLPVQLVVVDAVTGEPRVLDRDSGVSLVDAVAASCAVPGIWPPVTIDGRCYIDGGVRSATNADLAADANRVVVLAPVPDVEALADPAVAATVQALFARPTTIVVGPDDASTAAIGSNPLDPATREPAARAGRLQGASIGEAVAAVWTDEAPRS